MEVKVERGLLTLFSVGWWRAEDPVSDPKPFPRVTNGLVFRLNCLTASGSLEGPSQSLSPRGGGGTPTHGVLSSFKFNKGVLSPHWLQAPIHTCSRLCVGMPPPYTQLSERDHLQLGEWSYGGLPGAVASA